MLKACSKHMNVPVVLGARATDLPNKAAALVHALRLETGTSAGLQAMLASTVSFTSDMGVESGLPDFPKVDLAQLCVAQIPEELQDDVGAGADASGTSVGPGPELPASTNDSNFMFPHTLLICGVLHILANAASQVHERLGVWQEFKPQLKAVACFLHHGHYRDRLKSTCFGKRTRFAAFADFFNTACPMPIEWRWLVTQQVLHHILGLEHALLAGWNLQVFLVGGSVDADGGDHANAGGGDNGYRNRDSDATVSLSQVDEALRSPFFWATCKMIWHLGETVREMEGWSKGCPCHPRDSKLSAFKQQAVYNAELGRAASDQSDTCPGKGKRAPELAAGKLPSLYEEVSLTHYAFVLSASQSVPQEQRSQLLRAGLMTHNISLAVCVCVCLSLCLCLCTRIDTDIDSH